MMQKLTIAWAGGGTGGHVFPIKSLIQQLQKTPEYTAQLHKQYRFGTKGSMEAEQASHLQKEIKNLTFLPIFSGKWRREKTLSALLKNLWDLCLLIVGIVQSLRYLKKYRIDHVFCKGGYVALPVAFAAKILQIPIIVHESDVHPGLVNRIASKFSKQNFTGFPAVLPKAHCVGQILSDELLIEDNKKEEKADPSSDRTKVLVMWGSQWAKTIYQALANILKTYLDLQKMDFTLILGKLNQESSQLFANFPNLELKDFCTQQELGKLYQEADIAITRAGTTSLAEQELFDLQLIMIPIPRTHDQLDNAKRYVKEKNWILIQQDDPDFEDQLATTLLNLLSFKKQTSQRDKPSLITTAKLTILKSLFTS